MQNSNLKMRAENLFMLVYSLKNNNLISVRSVMSFNFAVDPAYSKQM